MKFCLQHQWRNGDGLRVCMWCEKTVPTEWRSPGATPNYVCFKCNLVNACTQHHNLYRVPGWMDIPSPKHARRWRYFQKQVEDHYAPKEYKNPMVEKWGG